MGVGMQTESLPEKSSVLGIPISPGGLGEIATLLSGKPPKTSLMVTFVNPWALAQVVKHPDYLTLLEAFDVVACDGIGMVRAAHTCGLKQLVRESFDFTSKADSVFCWAAANAITVGLVGGKPGVAERAGVMLRKKYPDLKVTGCYSGYETGPEDARETFRMQQTNLVICGMGTPLQERFLVELSTAGWHGAGFTCGGFFDQLNRGENYYPAWADHLNVRFLYRLAREPGRLWRRYLVDYQVFLRAYGKLRWNRIKSGLSIRPPGGHPK